MCQRMTPLVKRSDTRYIAQCEHGTIFLVWHRLALQMRPEEFARTAQIIERWCTDEDQPMIGDSFIRIFEQSSGHAQLWIGGVGLYLSPCDVLDLISLMRTAGQQLAAAQTTEPATDAGWHAAAYRELHVVPAQTVFDN